MEQVRTYFNAEKAESLLFIVAAAIALTITVYILLKHRSSFTFGVATSLLLITAVQIIVGVGIYFRSPADIARVEASLQSRSIALKEVEIKRMEVVMKNFTAYKYFQIFCIFLSIILMFLAANTSFWAGLGVGLLCEASFMLAFDFFAEKRGQIYLDWLNSLVSV